MNAIDLALTTGGAMAFCCALLIVRQRRRAKVRLDRLSRHRRETRPAPQRTPAGGRFEAVLADRPGAGISAGGALVGGIGLLLSGPVAALLGAAYSVVTLYFVRRRLLRREAERVVAGLLDAIEDSSGDLRAGVVPFTTADPYPGGVDVELYVGDAVEFSVPAARGHAEANVLVGHSGNGMFGSGPGSRGACGVQGSGVHGREVPGLGAAVRRVWAAADEGGAGRAGDGWAGGLRGPAVGAAARRRQDAAVAVALARLEAAHRVSEALGTPLADLLDQVEADVRAGQALRLNLAAQTSGAQTTTALLVGLPAAGLWLGAGIGVDPVEQLLHTPLGAACAVVAVALQCAGLLWTERMVRNVITEVR